MCCSTVILSVAALVFAKVIVMVVLDSIDDNGDYYLILRSHVDDAKSNLRIEFFSQSVIIQTK